MEQKITDLDESMKLFIDTQLAWVKGHFSTDSEYKFNTSAGKIYLLQGILDNNLYDKTKTAELQALGICLGEILSQELKLNWVIVEDEYGKDPALRYKDSSILFFPRTMISKRIEKDEYVDILLLTQECTDSLNWIIKKENQ